MDRIFFLFFLRFFDLILFSEIVVKGPPLHQLKLLNNPIILEDCFHTYTALLKCNVLNLCSESCICAGDIACVWENNSIFSSVFS